MTTASTLHIAHTGERFLLRFPNLTDFVVASHGDQIGAWPAPTTNAETLRHLLLDQVLPRVLAHQGHLVLHAGAVRVGAQAVAFLGLTGEGKSTLVASLYAAGYPLLSDDGLVLAVCDNQVLARPTYPSLRLWPDAVAGLFATPPALASMAHYSSKQRVILPEPGETADLPLAALYVLASTVEASDDEVLLTPLSPRDACMAIIRNAFQLDVTDRRRAAGLLAAASEVARQVPAFTLAFPRDFARLPEVHAAILQQREQWAGASQDQTAG